MKKIIFTLAFMLTTIFSFATTSTTLDNFEGTIILSEYCPNETTEISLTFDSIQDFENFSANELANNLDDFCSASITVKVSVGLGNTYASAEVTVKDVPCDKIAETTQKLKKELKKSLS